MTWRFLLFLIGASLLTFPLATRGDDILIGEYGSLTGGTATFGTSTDEGVRLAMDQINAAYERLLKSDVKYRFVIDMGTLGRVA